MTRAGRRTADPKPAPQSAARPDLVPTVLVVDAAVGYRDTNLLEASGYIVLTATGEDAAVVAAHRDPDVIVLNPEIGDDSRNAYEDLRRTCSHIPIIILTSRAASESLHELGADAEQCAAVVAKPCSCANLATVIERVRHGHPGGDVSGGES